MSFSKISFEFIINLKFHCERNGLFNEIKIIKGKRTIVKNAIIILLFFLYYVIFNISSVVKQTRNVNINFCVMTLVSVKRNLNF